MLQQQHRYKRSTNPRHKVRILDSKSVQSTDSDQSNKQHYGERHIRQTRHQISANKQAGGKINLISQFQTEKNNKMGNSKKPTIMHAIGTL